MTSLLKAEMRKSGATEIAGDNFKENAKKREGAESESTVVKKRKGEVARRDVGSSKGKATERSGVGDELGGSIPSAKSRLESQVCRFPSQISPEHEVLITAPLFDAFLNCFPSRSTVHVLLRMSPCSLQLAQNLFLQPPRVITADDSCKFDGVVETLIQSDHLRLG